MAKNLVNDLFMNSKRTTRAIAVPPSSSSGGISRVVKVTNAIMAPNKISDRLVSCFSLASRAITTTPKAISSRFATFKGVG